eukprot:TRINITY_DN1286_c0_g1_i3.p1 TRINITY_DN1286_c0_g1~~TRINITY_DN1286_c0_g1_i3.p1  ORF type:complete len:716 (-),score=103.51 TRINITY_DN1286_c0_g1_i3:85-2193(-)
MAEVTSNTVIVHSRSEDLNIRSRRRTGHTASKSISITPKSTTPKTAPNHRRISLEEEEETSSTLLSKFNELTTKVEELTDIILELQKRLELCEGKISTPVAEKDYLSSPENVTLRQSCRVQQFDLKKEQNLESLVACLRESIDLRDEKSMGLQYKAFCGYDAIKLLKEKLNLEDSNEAKKIGQLLLNKGLIKSIVGNKLFQSKRRSLYRFADASDTEKTIIEDMSAVVPFIGQLRVNICEIKSDKDFFDKGGHYFFIVTADGASVTTRSMLCDRRDTTWQWNVPLLFMIFHSNSTLVIELWKKSSLRRLHRDHQIGTITVSLSSLDIDKPNELYYPLKSLKIDNHIVELKIRLHYSFLTTTKDSGNYLLPNLFPHSKRAKTPLQHMIGSTKVTIKKFLSPNHRCGADKIILFGSTESDETVEIDGYFRYSVTSLKQEAVDLWIQEPDYYGPLGAWKHMGESHTDKESGKVVFKVPKSHFDKLGRYPIQMIVKRDHSVASGNVWVLKPKTQVVVYDIDGTLTIGDQELIKQLTVDNLNVEYNPRIRNGTVAMVRAWFAKGYLPVYLSGRAGTYYNLTRVWLIKKGFPPGIIGHTDSAIPTLPMYHVPGSKTIGVGNFKKQYLRQLQSLPLSIKACYGNTSNDIHVYSVIGKTKKQIFIVGPKGKKSDNVTDLGKDYVNHMNWLDKLKPAKVPCPNRVFDWKDL